MGRNTRNLNDPKYLKVLEEELDKKSVITSIRNIDDPDSVINMLPKKIQDCMALIPESYFTMPEASLKKTVDPTPLWCRLRISFWDEYNTAKEEHRNHMLLKNVTGAVCTIEYFYTDIITNPNALGWVLRPPKDYMLAMREMLDTGLDRIREIIDLPFINEKIIKVNGKDRVVRVIDPKIMAEIRAAVGMLDQRVNGAIIKKLQIDQNMKSMNMHMHADASQPPQAATDEMAKLIAMEEKLHSITAAFKDANQILGLQDPEEPDTVEVNGEKLQVVQVVKRTSNSYFEDEKLRELNSREKRVSDSSEEGYRSPEEIDV